MIKITPFRAIRYNKKNISALICPPYDIIPPSQKSALLKKSPYNAIRIELPATYRSARKNFEAWKLKGIIGRDVCPAFYIYEQSFSFKGKRYDRKGFFALLKTEKFGKNIFPHEKTRAKAKQDRFNLLKTSKINTSPIFCLFSDNGKVFSGIVERIKRQTPSAYAEFSGVSEKMWLVDDNRLITALEKLLKNNKILIADGHHRYETFFEFTKGGDVLTFLCPFEDKGLLILPTHRLLKDWSEKETAKLEKLITSKKGDWSCKLYYKKKFYFLRIPKKDKFLPVEILHSSILKDKEIWYEKDEAEAVKSVNNGQYTACIIMKPISVSELKSVVKNKKVLPPKSTYFYPKISTGFLFNEL